MTITTPRDDRFLFLDLETTGFDPRADAILEVAAILTDRDLVEIARWRFLVSGGHHREVIAISDMSAPPDKRALPIHEASGLLAELDAAVTTGTALTPDAVDQRLVHALGVEHDIARGALELAGFSISFDRGFVAHRMPGLAAYLSHRSVDVSTLRSLTRRWVRPPLDGPKAHRAMADCEHAIADLRWYRELLFDPAARRETGSTGHGAPATADPPAVTEQSSPSPGGSPEPSLWGDGFFADRVCPVVDDEGGGR